ncbi:universal stress protein [Nocardioides alkalitolerans]|uniref:universal stress protein n=1 Tax=Nocardioides alkalitolerans TaxID=281714 RepID=UPI00041EFE9F|nr:universal stress protein [Nocardioides alkalitolerans]
MTVLVGYVDTAPGNAAYEAAVAEAARRGEPLVVLNSPQGGALVDKALVGDERRAELASVAAAAGVAFELRQPTHHDDLAGAIAAVADEVDASVVVIGIRRRSPVGKLFLGSDAQRVLLDLDRPILAVKPRS